MSTIKQETHRPGAFKQSNKQHKTGRHRSKSAINNDFKGKFSVHVIVTNFVTENYVLFN